MQSGRHEHFLEYRRKYPEFIYSGYDISQSEKALSLDFHFIIPGLAEFSPHWNISKLHSCIIDLEDRRLNELVFSLGMVELVSYWKTTCSPEVHIACKSLSENQAMFWKKLYKNGLGEFFYTNKIEVTDDFMNITAEEGNHFTPKELTPKESKIVVDNTSVLIPIGGGKDSAVTLELLKDHAKIFCYLVNPRKAMLDTLYAALIPNENVVIANRTLDENMLTLNKQGFLNGHTPFSALVAFSSVIAAYIHGTQFVALSNESSANESTVLDSDINHQYSKGIEFETDFINYEKQYISSGVSYFSLLRPFTEMRIAEYFSQLEKYHLVFQSCNVGSKKDIWCAGCPKCLFVYIILSPFLAEDKMVKIFGKNMLSDAGLIPILEQLVGLHTEKPFECVGSCKEVNAALQEIALQYESMQKPLPKLVSYNKGLGISGKYSIAELCNSFDTNNHVPKQFLEILKPLCSPCSWKEKREVVSQG